MVFYRKYRPQSLDELDSEDVKTLLMRVLSSETIPHAFLFTGPKGLGKTSTARIVAKYVNCVSEKGFTLKGHSEGKKPCNTCIQCTSITEGTNIDVLEIDGASNRGIDEMRDLREKIRLLPVTAKKKVYIIDEVHMLTTEAFNALLKTLEEPPAHAIFILCTTEPHKVPGTILSRCFHIQFKKATTKDLVASFERIIQGEGMSAEKEALEVIASFADGSFRDGAKILEEITLHAHGKRITKDMVDAAYHVSSIDQDIAKFLEAFLQKDAKKGLKIIQHLEESGIDIKYFTEQVLFSLHTMLLQKTGVVEESPKLDIDLVTIRSLADVFSKAYGEMKYAVIPQLPLELAVVEWAAEEQKVESIALQHSKDEGVSTSKPTQKETASSQIPRSDTHVSKTFMFQLLDAVKVENHMLAGVLRSCRISNSDMHIQIEAPSTFHKEKLEDKHVLQILGKICENILGKNVTISVILKSG